MDATGRGWSCWTPATSTSSRRMRASMSGSRRSPASGWTRRSTRRYGGRIAPDEITLDPDGRLLGIVGHGTFIAGLVAHVCPQAAITVGRSSRQRGPRRRWCQPIPPVGLGVGARPTRCVKYRDADVIQCGFAFPTLDDQPSLPFAAAMDDVTAAHPGIAVVAPAGNEESPRRYWPAALPDVIGVAATKHDGRHRAQFSNWGPWADAARSARTSARPTSIGRAGSRTRARTRPRTSRAGRAGRGPRSRRRRSRRRSPERSPSIRSGRRAEAFDKLIAGDTQRSRPAGLRRPVLRAVAHCPNSASTDRSAMTLAPARDRRRGQRRQPGRLERDRRPLFRARLVDHARPSPECGRGRRRGAEHVAAAGREPRPDRGSGAARRVVGDDRAARVPADHPDGQAGDAVRRGVDVRVRQRRDDRGTAARP